MTSQTNQVALPYRAPVYAVLLLLTVFALYGRIFSYPYVDDDYVRLYHASQSTAVEAAAHVLAFHDRLLYRPVTGLYAIGMYHAFGLDARPHHAVALLLHAANAFLAAMLAGTFLRRRWAPWVVGLLYLAATGIHIDTPIWLVGIGTLAGTFFFLLGLVLFFGGRFSWSAAAFFLATVSRADTVGWVPLVLLGVALGWPRRYLGREWLRLWPYALSAGAYWWIKSQGTSPFAIPAGHAYHASMSLAGARDVLALYAGWLVQPLLGLYHPVLQKHLSAVTGGVVLVALLLTAVVWCRRKPSAAAMKATLFLLTWVAVTLGPALLFPRHVYRYYASYALVAVLILYAQAMAGLAGKRAEKAMGILLVLQLAAGAWFLRSEMNKGIYQHYLVGSNNLIRRAAAAGLAQQELLRQVPRPADGALFVLQPMILHSLGDGPQALRLWYRNPTLEVGDLDRSGVDAHGFYLRHPDGSRFYPDGRRLYVFRYDGRGLFPLYLPPGQPSTR